MKSITKTLCVLASLAATMTASWGQTKHYLSIGDPAPALGSATWVKGTAPAQLKPGIVYVVEFWATWCTPCKENIPHLTELSHKYAGKASFDGISIWESLTGEDKGYAKKVRDFVKTEGDKMDYNVAYDDAANHVAKSWMTAAGESAIPTAFVIGKDMKIAWIGHPENLEAVLQQVLDSKWDVKAAQDHRVLDKQFIHPIQEAMEAKKYKMALAAIDSAVKQRPELDRMYEYDRLIALDHLDLPTAIARSNKILADSSEDIGAYRMIVSIFATEKDLKPEAYEYGAGLCKKAIAKNEMKYLFLSMMAEISLHDKKPKDAVDFGAQAITEAKVDPHAPPAFIEFLKTNETKYQASIKS